ncbi:MAG: glycosyltransferase [Candidatus Levybacteria bacterium]|nr:glycosyltransferase [Candidatus Levybacteria bacterium]
MYKNNTFTLNLLSVVIPAYKQEKTIVQDIKHITDALDAVGYKYEVIVIIDGIVDKTYEKAKRVKSSKVKVVAYKKNEGKGFAIRHGMLMAKGDIIGFIDAGMDIHTVGFDMLLNHMKWYNADVIVGSKMHSASKVNYPFYRKILSWGYRLFTRMLFGFKVRDTQVGIKFFKREVVQDVLPRLLVKRYAFDIEILAVAYALGYKRIYEAPVEINFRDGSITSKNMWRIIGLMLWDTAAVFYRLKILKYYDKKNNKFENLRPIKSS